MTLVMSVTRIEDLAKCKKDLIKILILQFHASGHQKMKMSIQLKASNLKLTLCLLDHIRIFLLLYILGFYKAFSMSYVM